MKTIRPASPDPHKEPNHPEFFPLPKPGQRDPYFGNSRSWYYAREDEGLLALARIRGRGKTRGITPVPYDAVAKLMKDGTRGTQEPAPGKLKGITRVPYDVVASLMRNGSQGEVDS
jgi:hypothetical protein